MATIFRVAMKLKLKVSGSTPMLRVETKPKLKIGPAPNFILLFLYLYDIIGFSNWVRSSPK